MKPRCVWLRMPIFKDLEKARRLPVRVEEQQAQQLSMNPPDSAGDGRQEIQLTVMENPWQSCGGKETPTAINAILKNGAV